jgi:transposase
VFVGRRRQIVKVLFADATGVCVFYKRLDKGTFSLPEAPAGDVSHVEIDESALDALLDGIPLTPGADDERASPRRRRPPRVH